MIRSAVLLLAASLAMTPALAAKPPEILKRSGQWAINYDKDACHLSAAFGTEGDVMAIRFTRFQPGAAFDMAIAGKRVRTTDVRSNVKINFGPEDKPFSKTSTNGRIGDVDALFFQKVFLAFSLDEANNLIEASPELEASITGVTIAKPGKKPFRLEFGSLGKPMELMRHCTANLIESWGYDPKVQATLSRRAMPINDPTKWLVSSDYPIGAMALGNNGIVQFRLDVDEQGKATGCHVLSRTRPDVFADTTCDAVIRRAKLEPALDASGKPVRSFYINKVLWRTGS